MSATNDHSVTLLYVRLVQNPIQALYNHSTIYCVYIYIYICVCVCVCVCVFVYEGKAVPLQATQISVVHILKTVLLISVVLKQHTFFSELN